ncbi:MAG: hypothetical protein E6767_07625 [Dysgonomonas sp.]|nr:hypothetical protein [Dysgonomonas sp.]
MFSNSNEKLDLIINELSSLKKEINELNSKIDNLKEENEGLKEYIKKVGNTIIDNQRIIDGHIIKYKEDYLEPTYINAGNAAQWIYDIKDKLRK